MNIDSKAQELVLPDFRLSERFREAFKIALAMLIAYGVALAMNWEKPFWAAMPVAFAAMSPIGDSILNGVQRVLGTTLAAVVSLVLIALFPQDRWAFLITMSAIIALCTYRMSASPRYFIWLNVGFNIPILAMVGGVDGVNSFHIAILRTEETLLGVLAVTLVGILLWPRPGGMAFERAVRGVGADQRQLLAAYVASLFGTPDATEVAPLRGKAGVAVARLGGQLEGAAYDSEAIWLHRTAWRHAIATLSALGTAMERWRLGFDDLRDLDLGRLMPGLRAAANEFDARLGAFGSTLENHVDPRPSDTVDLQLDPERLRALGHFERAALLAFRDQLAEIDRLTRRLRDLAGEIRDHGQADVGPAPPPPRTVWGILDADRLERTVRQSSALWLMLLAALYIPAYPNPIATIALTNVFAMLLVMLPHVSPAILYVPTLLGAFIGGALYMFVMPHLEGYWQLGTLIFIATFTIAYVFHEPKAALMKGWSLCMLVIMLGVDNQQHYSFIYFALWLVAGVAFVSVLVLTYRLPISFRPEERFGVLLARFLASARGLVGARRRDGVVARHVAAWLQAWRLQAVRTLPGRLVTWGGALPPAAHGGAQGKAAVQAFASSLQLLANRLQALVEVRHDAEGALASLHVELEAWRAGIESGLQQVSVAPATIDIESLNARLEELAGRIETQVNATLTGAPGTASETVPPESLYPLLGAYRGVSEALVALARASLAVDWPRLRETRF